MKVDGSLKSLLQGVSQQPYKDRLTGQATLQENFISDPVSGLTRRPPTDLIGKLGSATTIKGWHNFKTRDGNRFIAWFHDSTAQVFDLNASEATVTIDSAALPYLAEAGKIRANTDEEDVTTFVNQSVVPAMLTDTISYFNNSPVYASVIQVLGGAYGRTYSISIDGVVKGSFATPDGSVATHSAQVDTKYIATELMTSLATTMTGYTLVREEDVILIYRSGAEFKATASDGYGNINIKCMNDTVPETADLPRIAPHLYVVRVAEKTDPEKDLWFKFVVDNASYGTTPNVAGFGLAGYWQETVAPNVHYKFDLDTMPHILDYDAGTGDFSLSQGTWASRGVGTYVSNPNPSFIGTPIKDVSSFQGRSVLVAGSNVCMSRTNKPFDHWFGSASALADTDPIDINSTVESSSLISAVQHNRDLVVFSNEAQFVVFGRTKATPANASLVLTTRFESETGAHPVGAGKNVFFAANYGSYTAMREFFAEGNTDINDSRPITQHVKKYITGKAVHLSTSSNYDMLMVHTDTGQTRVYIYQYIWSDTEKVQSAWHSWISEHPIVYSFFDEDRVYFVQKVGTDYYLLRMPLDVQIQDGVPYPVHLDQRFDVAGANTAFLLPYDYLHDAELVVVQGTGCPTPGLLAPIKTVAWDAGNSAYRVTLKRDMEGGDLVCGTRYMSKYVPTMPTVKDKDNVSVGTGNLRLRMFLVTLVNSGEITGRAISQYGNSEEVRFNGRLVGDIDNIVGEQPLTNEQFVMPFRLDAEEAEVEFYTNSHLPLTMSIIEWIGQYSKRGRRIENGGR
jgi:hypothetical protein